MDPRSTEAGWPRPSTGVAAQLACQDLIHAFADFIDRGTATQAATLFTDAGEMRSAGRAVVGQAALQKVFAKREADRARRTRHQVSNIVFEQSEPTRARAQSMLCLFVLGGEDATSPRAVSLFEDEFELGDDGRWRFAARTTVPLAGSR
jgi:hypothetical protein